jgi:hypothetical protein
VPASYGLSGPAVASELQVEGGLLYSLSYSSAIE